MKKVLFLLAILISIRAAAQKIPDSTFGHNAVTTTQIDQYSAAYKLKQTGHGKILAGGNAGPKAIVCRYNPNGIIDSSFGDNGVASLQIPGYLFYMKDMVVAKSGQILLCGYSYVSSPLTGFVTIICFNQDGVLDTSFNHTGYVLTKYNNNYEFFPHAIAMDTSDKIFIAGAASLGGLNHFLLASYFIDGRIDSSFTTNGYRLGTAIEIDNTVASYASISALSITTDGKLLVTGDMENYLLFTMRFLNDGSTDNSYGQNGARVITNSDTIYNAYAQTCVQADGKVVISAKMYNALDSMVLNVYRVTATGQMDAGFATNGKGRFYMRGTNNMGGNGYHAPITVAADGKIIVASYIKDTGSSYIPMLRLLANGTKDNTYGTNGVLLAEPIHHDVVLNGNNIWDIAFQPDGKLLMCGKHINAQSGGFDYMLTRYMETSISQNVASAEWLKDVQVYPNPTANDIYISANESMELQVTDVAGREVMRRSIANGGHISLAGQAKGTYYLQFRNKQNQTCVRTVLVQ